MTLIPSEQASSNQMDSLAADHGAKSMVEGKAAAGPQKVTDQNIS
jgi:hypothetical protein